MDHLESLTERAIQIARNMGDTAAALAVHREALRQVSTELADTIVIAEREQWKIDTLATYTATVSQITRALTVLGCVS